MFLIYSTDLDKKYTTIIIRLYLIRSFDIPSSNVDEVIRAISNVFTFLRKDFTHTKSTKSTKHIQANKNKKGSVLMRLKTSKGKKVAYLLVFVLRFLCV